MLHILAAGTHFNRVTDRGRSWPDVLSGAGAFFSFGGCYNRVQQKTVYAAEDPLVSISEYAYHQAVDLQQFIGAGPLSAHPVPRPPLPLVSEHFLWCFTLQHPQQVVNVEDPIALNTFHHQPHELLNPSRDAYHRTAMLADLIRVLPNARRPVAGGIIAPSVRTPAAHGYIPQQQIFFVPHSLLAIPGTLLRRWRLTIEFADVAAHSVTPSTRDIHWASPWFRVRGLRLPVPAFARRPRSHEFDPGAWYQIAINFA